MLLFVVALLFADDFELFADCTLFFTASEENSNESRFALLAVWFDLAFVTVFELLALAVVFDFAVDVFAWELFEAVLVFAVDVADVFDGVCFAVGVERVNVSRLGAEEVCLLCVGVLALWVEPER